MRRTALRALCLSFAIAAAALALVVAPAAGEFGFVPGSLRAEVSSTQAGAHPDASTSFAMNMLPSGAPDGNPKDIVVDLPPGVVGNPTATPRCDPSWILSPDFCPRDTMVGVVYLDLVGFPTRVLPVFNIEPYPDQPAAFMFRVFNETLVRLDASVRSDGDYGLRVTIRNVNQRLSLAASRLVFWGVPADHNGPGPEMFDFSEVPIFTFGFSFGGRGTSPRVPFMTNPGECGVPGITTIRANSWSAPSEWRSAESPPTTLDGCEKLTFEPTLDLRPDNQRAGAPTGLAVDLRVPQNQSTSGLATPPLKDTTVVLPAGMAVSPSAADGLRGCTDQQVGLKVAGPDVCPPESRIGSVSIESPLLPDPLTGSIFLGSQKSQDAASGDLLRIFLVAGGSGVRVKLEGKIFPDPTSGQVTAVFRNNPQLPFHLLRLRFNGGPRASLANPQACGQHEYSATVTSWGGQSVTRKGSFAVAQDAQGRACAPLGFGPSLNAGMLRAEAGTSSTFTLELARDDTQQDLREISVAMPSGLTGFISLAEPCPEVAASTGTCGEASRIGSVTVGSGPGTNPIFLPGRVYLTASYKGAPFGLSIVVPAVAGPFDLGTVVVRSAIHVDRRDAALRVVADPLPTILQGIPLRIRTVNVRIDKDGFMLAPTDCSSKEIGARVVSVSNAVAQLADRFRVRDCAVLPFRPRLKIKIGAKGRTRAGITAPMDVTLSMTPGQANNRSVTVSLPRNINARLPVINERSCTLHQFETSTCARSNRVGTARAVTPLLKEPLQGDVYFVRNPSRRIPDLAVTLKGAVEIDLVGKVTVNKNLTLKTQFDTVPDVPISTFSLRLVAGRNGPVGFIANACTKRSRAERAVIAFRSHSGRFISARPRLSIVGCPTRATTRPRAPRRGHR
jgi:hypothetical protein